ncbi:MAG TPA: hypothetical protein VGP72_26470 [Planctomycetota bacterium]|jgi:hypothetical protein
MLHNDELERCQKVRQELWQKYGGLDGLFAHYQKLEKQLGIKKVGDKPKNVSFRRVRKAPVKSVLMDDELERCRKVRKDLWRKHGGLAGLCAHLGKMDREMGIAEPKDKPRTAKATAKNKVRRRNGKPQTKRSTASKI